MLAVGALVVPSLPHAAACSCATVDVRERLPEADGAFVGTLLSRDDPRPVNGAFSSATVIRYRYRVERVVKGDIPSGTVDIWAAAEGASCGLETPPGQRAGLLLDRQGDRWTSGLCSQADPDALVQDGQALPPPSGTVVPAVLVGASDGGGSGGRPILAGGAGAALLAAGAAGLRRRR